VVEKFAIRGTPAPVEKKKVLPETGAV
jgi:hypothetical protein